MTPAGIPYPPTTAPPFVLATTIPGPLKSTPLWNAAGFQPFRLASYTSLRFRNSFNRFILWRQTPSVEEESVPQHLGFGGGTDEREEGGGEEGNEIWVLLITYSTSSGRITIKRAFTFTRLSR